jgi:DNA-binding NtrC family response regulator
VGLAEAVEDPELLAYTSRVLGAVHMERDELEEAKQAITRAGRLMRGWTSSFERARVLFEEGRLLARTGAVEGAAEKLRRVEREFRQAGNPHWQLQALLLLAWVLREADPDQAASAEAGARLLVDAHGLEDLEQRIRRLLADPSHSKTDQAPTGPSDGSRGGRTEAGQGSSGAGPAPLADASLDHLAGILEQAVARDSGVPLDPDRVESVKRAAQTLGRVLDALLGRIDYAGPADAVELEANRFELLVGSSRPMREIYHMVRQVAPTDSTVLILGESGTGKELLARSIHNRSLRGGKVFAAINCPSIPRDLLESELFGHERGAFTGAIEARPGRIELAHEGTIFLDEVGDMPGPAQAKLLRFLQEREFERVGGRRTIRVDVRLLAATSRDLTVAMEQGQFRADLFYRLNVVPIRMPALRERREDIPILVEHFLRLLKPRDAEKPPRIAAAALDALLNHDWPGNVRELRNALEYMITIGGSETLDLRHLPAALRERAARGAAVPVRDGVDSASDPGHPIRPGETLESRLMRVEAALIRVTLEQERWNQSAAARRLGITESMIRNRMQQYGIRQSRQPGRQRGGP